MLIFQEQSQYYHTLSNPREHCTSRHVKAVYPFSGAEDQSTQCEAQTCSHTTISTDTEALVTIMTYYPRTSEFKSAC